MLCETTRSIDVCAEYFSTHLFTTGFNAAADEMSQNWIGKGIDYM